MGRYKKNTHRQVKSFEEVLLLELKVMFVFRPIFDLMGIHSQSTKYHKSQK